MFEEIGVAGIRKFSIMSDMTKVMKDAIDEVSSLPESDQETIGRQLLSHVEKLRRLRVEIDRGAASLDAGRGRELDIDAFVQRAKERDGGQ